MKQVWIIIVACAGFVLFLAWAVLFAYCLCRRYRRRKLNNNLENCNWYAKQKNYGDEVEIYPRADGLCQETLKRASVRLKRPDEPSQVNQSQSNTITTTTTAVVNEGFKYDDSDEKDKQYVENGVRSPNEETKPENYPDIIAATEQNGVPDVLIDTTVHGYQKDSLVVPEYRKPTLQEKIDRSPDFGRKLELSGQHSPQVNQRSSFYEQLRAVGRSSEYEDLVSVGRTSSLDNLATTDRKSLQRSGSAPSMSAREKVQLRKSKMRRPVSRSSSSLDSILESDYEDSFTKAGSMETLIKQKKSKKKRKSVKDETYQETTVFSFFTPDSSTAGDVSSHGIEGINYNSAHETVCYEDNIQQDSPRNDQLSTKVDGLENADFVLQEVNENDIHMHLSQDPTKQEESTKTYKDLTSSILATDQNSEEQEFESASVKLYSEHQSSELQSTTSAQQKTAKSDNLTSPSGNMIREAVSAFRSKKSAPSPVTSEAKLEKTTEETKSLMHVEVDMARSSHKRIVRTTSWAAEERAQLDIVEDNNSKSNGQAINTDINKNLKSTDLMSPPQHPRKIANLIDRFQLQQVNAPKNGLVGLKIEEPYVVHANENEIIASNSSDEPKDLKNTSVNVQAESIQIVKKSHKDVESSAAKDKLNEAELPKQTTKELDLKTSTDLTKLTANSAKTSPLPSPARKRQFNIGHAPYAATGIGLTPVMSELLTRVTVTDNQPRQEFGNSFKGETSLANNNNVSSSDGHVSSPTNENKDHSKNNSDPNVTSVVPEAPVFTAPLSQRKPPVSTRSDPSPKETPSSQRKLSLRAPVRPDGGPAPVTGAALMSVMPELQNRLRRISVQERTT